jgi:hypothetical protein
MAGGDFLAGRPRSPFPGAKKMYVREVVLNLEGIMGEVRYFVETQTDPEDPDQFERREIGPSTFHSVIRNGARWDLSVLILVPDEEGGTKEEEIYGRRFNGHGGNADLR